MFNFEPAFIVNMKKADGQRIERRKYTRTLRLHWEDCVRDLEGGADVWRKSKVKRGVETVG